MQLLLNSHMLYVEAEILPKLEEIFSNRRGKTPFAPAKPPVPPAAPPPAPPPQIRPILQSYSSLPQVRPAAAPPTTIGTTCRSDSGSCHHRPAYCVDVRVVGLCIVCVRYCVAFHHRCACSLSVARSSSRSSHPCACSHTQSNKAACQPSLTTSALLLLRLHIPVVLQTVQMSPVVHAAWFIDSCQRRRTRSAKSVVLCMRKRARPWLLAACAFFAL